MKKAPAKPNKGVTKIIEAHIALQNHRQKEQQLVADIQHLACKVLNNVGAGKGFMTHALVNKAAYAVLVHDRGKAPKGARGRPRLRYKTEVVKQAGAPN